MHCVLAIWPDFRGKNLTYPVIKGGRGISAFVRSKRPKKWPAILLAPIHGSHHNPACYACPFAEPPSFSAQDRLRGERGKEIDGDSQIEQWPDPVGILQQGIPFY